jgi:dTDP-4-dehydrorhamnose 3,5-epimerase
MEITPLTIEGSWLARSPLWSDDRGYFREWFKLNNLEIATGTNFTFEQANISQSSKSTIRGIHYSTAKQGQAKWITCVTGSIRDYVVDIRPNSKTFGQWLEIELTSISGKSLLIGKGLGHGFISLEDKTTVAYLVSTPYSPDEELGINPFDSEIAINWGLDLSKVIISEKDKFSPTLLQRRLAGELPE